MVDQKHTVLVLGASGMLGNAVLRLLVESGIEAWGSVRASDGRALPTSLRDHLLVEVDGRSVDSVARAIARVRPSVLVNCIGLVKQVAAAVDPLAAIPINSLLPHQLARLCELGGSRLVHVSTDCVFSGLKGMYREEDTPDARDLYGLSKFLGEVDYPHAVTLRTSIIGHELAGAHGLVGWFLAQRGQVRGYTKAIFSGLPTVELARVIRDHVLPNPQLRGVYHVSGEPISKYELLRLVAQTYALGTEIVPDAQLAIDRSLDSRRFRALTGYSPPGWRELVQMMHDFA